VWQTSPGHVRVSLLHIAARPPRLDTPPRDISLSLLSCILSQGHPDIINAAAWSPNGRLIATACDDMQLRVFDVAQLVSQNIKFKWVKTPQAALGVGFGNDGSSLVAALRGEQCWCGSLTVVS
jgi:WD40 repeat protein